MANQSGLHQPFDDKGDVASPAGSPTNNLSNMSSSKSQRTAQLLCYKDFHLPARIDKDESTGSDIAVGRSQKDGHFPAEEMVHTGKERDGRTKAGAYLETQPSNSSQVYAATGTCPGDLPSDAW
jgi:hypothetical protein